MAIRTKEIYRDACRRSHRILSSYLALYAWRKGVDCVVVDRYELFAYLGLKAMRTQRLQWLARDIRDLFPYTQALYQRTGAHGSTYLSRLKFPPRAFDGRMYDDERIKLLQKGGVRAADIRLPSEGRMVVFLAAAAAGVKVRKR